MDRSFKASDGFDLFELCVKVTALLHFTTDIFDTAQKVTSIAELIKTIKSIYRILGSIAQSLTSESLSDLSNGRALRTTVEACVTDCATTLQGIRQNLSNPKDVIVTAGVARQATRWEKTQETLFFNQQMNLHHTALTLVLQTLNACTSAEDDSKQDSTQKLKDLKGQIGKATEAVALQQQTSIPNTLSINASSNGRVSGNLYKLALQAESLRSSTSAGRDERRGNSDDHPNATTKPSLVSTLAMEKELLEEFKDLGSENLREHRYRKAETCYFEAIELFKVCNKDPDPEALDALQSRLALAYCAQAKWEAAEKLLYPMLRSGRIMDLLTTHCLHAIAMGYLHVSKLELAKQACRPALEWKEKKYGKEYRSYLVTAEILARICRAEGQHAEANKWRESLPKNLWLHGNNAWELYLTMSCPELDGKESRSGVLDVADGYRDASFNSQSADAAKDGSSDGEFHPLSDRTNAKLYKSGEEGFEKLFNMRGKMFIFDKTNSTWKERGPGEVWLVKYKSNGVTRLLMRRDKTFNIIADHRVDPASKLLANIGSDRSWVFDARDDASDGKPKDVTMALRFQTKDMADAFKDAFGKAQLDNVNALMKDSWWSKLLST